MTRATILAAARHHLWRARQWRTVSHALVAVRRRHAALALREAAACRQLIQRGRP